MAWLRQFPTLHMLTLVGNPLSASPLYQSITVAYLPTLVYLDHKRITAADRCAALQQHQVVHVPHATAYGMLCRSSHILKTGVTRPGAWPGTALVVRDMLDLSHV